MSKKNRKNKEIIEGEKQVIENDDVGQIEDVIGDILGTEEKTIEVETGDPSAAIVEEKDDTTPVVVDEEKTDPAPSTEEGPEIVDNSKKDDEDEVKPTPPEVKKVIVVKKGSEIKVSESFLNTAIRVEIRGAGPGNDHFGILKVEAILKSAMTIRAGFVKVPNKYVKRLIELGNAVESIPGIRVITDVQRKAVEFRIKPMVPVKK